MLDHARLDEDRRSGRVDAGCEPVDEHLPDAVLDPLGRLVMRRQRVPVGREIQAIVFLLEPQPVFQCAMVMTDVHSTGRPHARQYTIRKHCVPS